VVTIQWRSAHQISLVIAAADLIDTWPVMAQTACPGGLAIGFTDLRTLPASQKSE
jgi:hypothetical protein